MAKHVAHPAVGHFTSDAHALSSGGIFGLLIEEKNKPDGFITSVEPVLDESGNYKPYIDVIAWEGKKFRIIVAELDL